MASKNLPKLPPLSKLDPLPGLPPLSKGSEKKSDKEKLEDIKYQVEGQEEELGKKHKNSPSVLNRVFDVLSRGNYGIAEASRRSRTVENKHGSLLHTLDEWRKGFTAGVTGKKKTTFSDYFKEVAKDDSAYGHLAKNKAVQVGGGLALDIFADPTNAIGVGEAGKIKDVAELAKGGAEAAQGAIKTAEAAQKAKDAIKLAQKAGTINTTGKALTKQLKEIDKAARLKHANEVGDKAIKTATSINKPSLAIKVAGHPVVKSEKAYQISKHAKDAIAASTPGQTIRELFDTTYHYGHGTNAIRRRNQALAVHNYQEEASQAASIFHGLTEAESEHLKHALTAGAPPVGVSKHGKDLTQLFDEAQKIDISIFDRSKQLGLLPKKAKYDPMKYADDLAHAKGIDDYLVHRITELHKTIQRKSFVEEVAKKFGTRIDPALASQRGLVKADTSFVPKGYFFHPDIAKSLEYSDRIWNPTGGVGNIIHVYDKAQNAFKTLATVVNPGHHVQNLLGDVSQSFMAGVNNPLVYGEAAKAMKGGAVKIGGTKFTGKEIVEAFNKGGMDVGLISADFLKKKNALGKLRNASQIRENFARMAHFIDIAKKSGPIKNADELDAVAREASRTVNKFHFDYGDKTKFERDVMSRVIPFYTWTRKNMPNQIENLIQRPGRSVAFKKVGTAVENALGTHDNQEGDIVPEYIREALSIKLGKDKYLTPNLPITDIGRNIHYDSDQGLSGSLKEMLARQLSSTAPAIRIPFEQATGRSLFSGGPIGPDTDYFPRQIPVLNVIKKINDGKMTLDQQLNYLISAGYRVNTDKSKASELRRIKAILNAKVKKQREKEDAQPL